MKKLLLLCILLTLAAPARADTGAQNYATLDIGRLRAQADGGDAGAQQALAARYAGSEDFSEAARWYRKAAAQGDRVSEAALAGLYYDGKGVPRDDAQAAVWYRKAADQGDRDSQFDLGDMYLKGEGVPKSNIDAYFWLSLSGEAAGDRAAALDRITARLNPSEKISADAALRDWQPSPPLTPAADPCDGETDPSAYLACRDHLHKLHRLDRGMQEEDQEYQH